VIGNGPTATAVKSPVALTVAAVVPDFHCTRLEMSRAPSLYMPVATNCCVCPLGIVVRDDVIVNDCRTGGSTLSTVEALNEPDVAVMVVFPGTTLLASPPGAIVATPIAEEAHVTAPLTFCVDASLNVPVAANCWVRPFGIAELAGAMLMDFKTGGP